MHRCRGWPRPKPHWRDASGEAVGAAVAGAPPLIGNCRASSTGAGLDRKATLVWGASVQLNR